MTNAIRYSIVLPAYLEEENLRLLLPRIRATAEQLGGSYEIIVVDTTTALDGTKDACQKNGVRYLNRSPSNSFGDAVRTGINAAKGEWILFMDADGSHGPEFIPRLVSESDKFDVVIASRYVAGGHTENSLPLIFMSRVLNIVYAVVLGLPIKDVSNSFKIYRASMLKNLKLTCQNFDIVEEILIKIVRSNKSLKVKEIPFSFKKRMFGDTKRNLFLFMLTYLYTIVRLRFFASK